MPDDRPPRHGPPRDRDRGDRPGFVDRERGDRPGFVPRRPGFPTRSGPPGPTHDPVHSFRLRDGEREIEATGSPGFIRQLLDDLPVLLARLRGEPATARPASISLPEAPPRPALPAAVPAQAHAADTTGAGSDGNGHSADPLEERVLAVLRGSRQPMGIAEIRRRLDSDVSGQQVRRILERASDQVVNAGGRPAAYRIRQ